MGGSVLFLQFLPVAHISRVNCADMARDKAEQPTCEQKLLTLSRVS